MDDVLAIKPARARRLRRCALVALAALVLYALFGFLVVPRILANRIVGLSSEHFQRQATLERARFNPFTLTTVIDGFRLEDPDGETLLAFDRLRVDLQVSGLFRRAVRFRTIRIERPTVALRILENGRLSVADFLEQRAPDPDAAGPPRVIVDHFSLHGGSIAFTDASRQPAYTARFEPLELEVRDLVTLPEESGDHTVSFGIDGGAEVRWSGSHTVEPLAFTGRFDVTGLNLVRLWEYVGHGQPIAIGGGRADITLPYRLRKEPGQAAELSIEDATVGVRDVVARPRDGSEDWLQVPQVDVRGVRAEWPASRVEVGEVRVTRPHALVRIEQGGELNWSTLLPSEDRPDPASLAAGAAWDVRVAAVDLEQASVRFEDMSHEQDVALDVSEIGLHLDDVSSDLTAAVTFRAAARLSPSGTLEANGSIVPDSLDAQVELALADVDIAPLRPYFLLFRGAELLSGRASMRGSASIRGDPAAVTFAGVAGVDGAEWQAGGAQLLAWRRLQVEGLRAAYPPAAARIASVAVEGAFVRIFIDREGNLNLVQLASAGESEGVPAPAEPLPRVEIGVVELRDAAVDFTDESLILPFGTKIHSAAGTVRDLSTFAAAPATLAVVGRIDTLGSVRLGGVVRMSDPYASTDIEVAFHDLEMNALTPYSAEFAGYAIDSGSLDVDVRYRIENSRLVGDHRVVASDLVLGKKVEGASGVGLPVRLAVSLLKDKDGRIDLEVPIEGTLDSPEFGYRAVFWQAFKKILGNVAAAPFRALGRLFGNDEEDIELVEFDAGRSELLPGEQELLSRLAAEIGPRGELRVEVEGRFDPVSDPAALRLAKLEAAIEGRRAAAATAAEAAGGSTLEAILEALYAERFTPETLAAERARFEPAAALPTVASAADTPAKRPKRGKRTPAEPPPSPAEPEAPFDAPAFYEVLRASLLEAQSVTDAELATLASERAGAILAALGAIGTLDPSRLTALPPATVKRKKAGSDRVASEMMLTAGEP